MLRSLNSLVGYAIRATDGDLGKVDEFYFDDQTWTIRYVVVETGNWLAGRKVLLSPVALEEPDFESRTFGASLTTEQVRLSPDLDTDKPISRQHETKLSAHYSWPYWGSGFSYSGTYGNAMVGPFTYDATAVEDDGSASEGRDDPNLRSTRAVAGYHIHATDGAVGHVEDYIVDDESWILQFLVVDTANWLPGRKVLISPHWISNVDWDKSEVIVDLSREGVKGSPEFDPLQPVSADYAGQLHDYYGRPSPPETQ
jgi:uncharacterized protein YrrD